MFLVIFAVISFSHVSSMIGLSSCWHLVLDLFDVSGNNWDVGKLSSLFTSGKVQEIEKTSISSSAEDALVWHYDKRGGFFCQTVLSFYEATS